MKTLIIDGSGLISKASHFEVESRPRANIDIYFHNVLGAIRRFKPNYIYCCYSNLNIETSFRHLLYPDYQKRKIENSDYYRRWYNGCLYSINELNPLFNIQSIQASDKYEACDLISTLINQISNNANNDRNSSYDNDELFITDKEPQTYVLSFSDLFEQLLDNKNNLPIGLIYRDCFHNSANKYHCVRSNSQYFELNATKQFKSNVDINQDNETDNNHNEHENENEDEHEYEWKKLSRRRKRMAVGDRLNEFSNSVGIANNRLVDFWSLVGRQNDNVPGIKQVGEIKAAKLLKEYDNVANMLYNDDIRSEIQVLRPKIANQFENLKLFYEDIIPFKNDVDLTNRDYNKENIQLFDESYCISSRLYDYDNLLDKMRGIKPKLKESNMDGCIKTIDKWSEFEMLSLRK